ncbi:MAG: DUF2071 domain-containing protein [Sandaracinaceae bacterium]
MRIPVIRGVIERRILANFRVDPVVMAKALPPPFRPKTVRGFSVGGICLIRLRAVRPRWSPVPFGLSSENAAHRIAVEWDEGAVVREGVFVPRRDTSSWANAVVGGRLFPGVQHHARFAVDERGDDYSVSMVSQDDATHVSFVGSRTDRLPRESVFESIAEVSAFFEQGSLGYSCTRTDGRFDGLELRTKTWSVAPLTAHEVTSSYFEDERSFPAGSVAFDNALLMRDIDHEWHGRDALSANAP